MEAIVMTQAILTKFYANLEKQEVTYNSSDVAPGGAIQVGYSGVVDSIGYVEISGRNATPRTAQQGDQVVKFEGKNYIIAKVGEMSKTFALSFKGGKTLSLSTLQQSTKSKIGATPCTEITMKEYFALKGKTLTLTAITEDSEVQVVVGGQAQPEPGKSLATRSAKAYIFAVK